MSHEILGLVLLGLLFVLFPADETKADPGLGQGGEVLPQTGIEVGDIGTDKKYHLRSERLEPWRLRFLIIIHRGMRNNTSLRYNRM